jgi:hypothetical protein
MRPLLKLTTYMCTLKKLQCETYKRQRPQDGYNLNILQLWATLPNPDSNLSFADTCVAAVGFQHEPCFRFSIFRSPMPPRFLGNTHNATRIHMAQIHRLILLAQIPQMICLWHRSLGGRYLPLL